MLLLETPVYPHSVSLLVTLELIYIIKDGGLDDRSMEEPRRHQLEFREATCICLTGYGEEVELSSSWRWSYFSDWTCKKTATMKKLATPTAWQCYEPQFFYKVLYFQMVTNCTFVTRDCWIKCTVPTFRRFSLKKKKKQRQTVSWYLFRIYNLEISGFVKIILEYMQKDWVI